MKSLHRNKCLEKVSPKSCRKNVSNNMCRTQMSPKICFGNYYEEHFQENASWKFYLKMPFVHHVSENLEKMFLKKKKKICLVTCVSEITSWVIYFENMFIRTNMSRNIEYYLENISRLIECISDYVSR